MVDVIDRPYMESLLSTNKIHSPLTVKPAVYLKTTVAVIVAGAIGIVIGGLYERLQDHRKLVEVAFERAVPMVAIARVDGPRDAERLTLPGTLQAYYSAPIYARVPGYLKRWKFDIGSRVKAGQVLAEIETPELDQQLKQSVANLVTARANEKLAEVTARRWRNLLKTDAVSLQEADEKSSDHAAKKSIVVSNQANVDHLRVLESFKRVTAPFDGVVATRNTDVGALINAGQQAGRELFTIVDAHKLRLYVSVPQSYVNRIKPGMEAQVEVPEHPGQHFPARLVGNAQSINEASGTVLMQLEVDNVKHTLLPGEYGSVVFSLPANEKSIQIPPSALVFRQGGTFVVVVGADNRVTFKRVEVLHDFGTSVEIVSGLTGQEAVINNPLDTLVEGDLVKINTPALAAPLQPKS